MRRIPLYFVLLSALCMPLAAQVSTSDGAEFLGEWTLAMDMQGRAVEMVLVVSDQDGELAASLTSARSPEPTTIEEIRMEGGILTLSWKRDMQGQEVSLNMTLAAEDQGLNGNFGDENGFFSAEVAGKRTGAAVPTASDVDGDGEADDDAAASSSDSRRRRRGGESSVLSTPTGEVKISYHPLEVGGIDWQTFEELDEGDVFSYVSGRSIKLMSEPSLDFDGTVVAAGNASPDYPGVYSVWLRKTAAGWSLVFNHDADIWGTQRLPERDAAEVPAEYSPADQSSAALSVELVEADGGGILRLAWGGHQWMAPFQVVP